MFSKISRYKRLKDIVTVDAGGCWLKSRIIRLLPGVSGTFLHTVEENDRLDHLAFKYYKQPGKWWRICDANPEFKSPLALLGNDPVVTTRFPVSFVDSAAYSTEQPAWHEIIKRLSQVPGVHDVSIREYAENFKIVVIVTHNHLNVTAEDLKEDLKNAIKNEEVEIGDWVTISRVGKKIVIPPDVVG